MKFSPLRPALRAGETLLERTLCILGAIATCQLPEFIQQYRQRLGGHLDEARRQLDQFESVAARSQLTLADFIERTARNSDEAVARLAGLMREAVERVQSLSAADTALRDAGPWEKPFVFLSHLDPSIAQGTWEIYRPAVPTTLEGLVYALIGLGIVLGLYHGLVRPAFRMLSGLPQRWRQRRAASVSPKSGDAPPDFNGRSS